MAACNKPHFPLQCALDIKDHVTFDLRVGNRDLAILTEFKGNSNLLLLLLNGVQPEDSAGFIVNSQSFPTE